MRISEMFYSIQGEGLLAGVPSVFVRLSGCPLRCRWCDTKYSWDSSDGEDVVLDEIQALVQARNCDYVVITGGEPLIQAELGDLVKLLKQTRKHVTIETAGISFVPDLSCDLMSISPKLSNSIPDDNKLAEVHNRSRLNVEALRKLVSNYAYQLKFVVDSPEDIAEIQETIEEIGGLDRAKIMLMPQSTGREEYIEKSAMVAELCKQTGFVFCPRLQILLWDNERGT